MRQCSGSCLLGALAHITAVAKARCLMALCELDSEAGEEGSDHTQSVAPQPIPTRLPSAPSSGSALSADHLRYREVVAEIARAGYRGKQPNFA